MLAKTLMVQGTASSVGKSVLVTALCRILKQDGWKVAPFKAQNMSLNSFVTAAGDEIGRAQVVQAEAAGVAPAVEMNPILLKPEADQRSQVIVMGRPLTALTAQEYYERRKFLWNVITGALEKLSSQFELLVLEGAGSPAEVNLKEMDLVNMRVAMHCRAPVLLAADIDRGGVFASLVGTLELLEPQERALVKGIVINKFRGDLALLEPGLRWLEQRESIPVAGVIPYFHDIHVAEEDSLSLDRRRELRKKSDYLLDVAVIGFPHISNFDEFDPLEQEEEVRLRYVEDDPLGEPDLIILPGTKSTMADLVYLRRRGLAQEINARAASGTPVIGICGGYQMMGETISDPQGVESSMSQTTALGLLPTRTIFHPAKSTCQVRARANVTKGLLQGSSEIPFNGYEIHMGQTEGARTAAPFVIEERSRKPCREQEGCLSDDGWRLGTYIHGLFHNECLRHALLGNLAARKHLTFHPSRNLISKEEQYDRLADWVRGHLNMELVYRLLEGK